MWVGAVDRDMRQTRRSVLATMGLAATAGCSGVAGNPFRSGEESNEYESFRKETVEEISETVTIPKGKYRAYEFTFDTQTVLLYTVVASDHVDAIVLHRDAFETYEADVGGGGGSTDELTYISPLSDLATRATSKGSAVTAGEPVLVVDNTTWAKAPPSEVVEVEVEVDAFVRKTQSKTTGNEAQGQQVKNGSENAT